MPTFRRPDARLLAALVVALFLASVAVGWAVRRGRVQNTVAPTPAPPGAPGPPGAAGAPGVLPAPAPPP